MQPPAFVAIVPSVTIAEAAMHWRKAPSGSNGKVFYVVIAALFASAALTTALLVLHRFA
jgi:hypothetical protein